MKKISTALTEIIARNNFLMFGLKNNLLNLSKTASYLKPLVEIRTKKQVADSAVLMGLSRINRQALAKTKDLANKKQTLFINFTIKTNLCSFTYINTAELRKQLDTLYPQLRGQKGYFTQSQGISEYSITIDESQADLVKKYIKEKPKAKKFGLVSIDMQMHESFYNDVGVISEILQQIAYQGISVHELSSTYNELIFCVDSKNLKLTFDTLCLISEEKEK